MLRSSLISAAAVILCGSVTAQSLDTYHDGSTMTPVRHGGTYHVATGTWTRNVPDAVNLGVSDVIYDNTANAGGWTSGRLELVTDGLAVELIDAGRVPGTTSNNPNANRDNYNVNDIEIGYCVDDDSGATAPLDVAITLYGLGDYTTCQDPATSTVLGGFVGTGLPGFDPATPMGFVTCWNVNFDLTGAEICMLADGDGFFDNNLDFDQFGIGMTFDPASSAGYVGGIAVGPIIVGDRDWTAGAAGEILPAGVSGGGGGGGTYYGPVETCIPTLPAVGENSSGYDTEDANWTGDRPTVAGGLAAGCYWFGGYVNGVGCDADDVGNHTGVPAGFHSILTADQSTDCTPNMGPSTFCDPGNNNSTGFPSVLAATTGTGIGSGLHLEVTGGPANEFGYVLVGDENDASISLGNGVLCINPTTGVLGRYNVGTTRNSLGQFDGAGVYQNLSGTSTTGQGFDVPTTLPIPAFPTIMAGETWHFQFWHRDTPAGVGQSNLSNGVSVAF